MDILIVGGFLGSGKTSLIRLLVRGLVNGGRTCAIVENEIGEIGIDAALIQETGLEVTPLFGGCVCCQISGDLLTAINRIQDEIAPDWVIVEMTGLALMDRIQDVFGKYGRADIKIHTVSVVDLSRWRHLIGALSVVFEHQIAGADVILLNKTDVVAPTDETYALLREKASDAIILQLDATLKEPDALWAALMRCIEARKEEAKA